MGFEAKRVRPFSLRGGTIYDGTGSKPFAARAGRAGTLRRDGFRNRIAAADDSDNLSKESAISTTVPIILSTYRRAILSH
jgi:hypothetical protein